MKDNIKKVMERVPKWVKATVSSLVIIILAVCIDSIVQSTITRVGKIVGRDDTVIFQLDGMRTEKDRLVLDGWVFKLEVNSEENDFDIILYESESKKKHRLDVEETIRNDVNNYFSCEYDYSKTGFRAEIDIDDLKLDTKNYEILVQYKDEPEISRTGVYLSKGEIKYYDPEQFVQPNVKGEWIENVINEGVLRLYRPNIELYVYQLEDELIWIFSDEYLSSKNSDYMELQVATTQPDKLPKHRVEMSFTSDNIRFSITQNEIQGIETEGYRIAVTEIPKQYSIVTFWCGDYSNKWEWVEYFRPWYHFD
ncbi:MAG: hypothetical protein IJW18_03080 [Lachnospiraceae bacterium]|nr:hypothetical protein [Lachnospiraceae bacterium]